MLDVQIDAGPCFFFVSMKYLYIDESIDEKHFAVEGILCDSEKDMLLACNRLKKQISRIPLTSRVKERINYEFKSSLLDRSYPKIKKKMLYKLNAFDCQVVYSCRNINGTIIQKEKNHEYIYLKKIQQWNRHLVN